MGKGKMIFRYSDVGGAFLSVGLYCGKRLVKKQVFCFSPDEASAGVPLSAEELAQRIRAEFSSVCDFILVVASQKIFKTVVSVPPTGAHKSKIIAEREILKDYPDYKEKYFAVPNICECDGGQVLSYYFIPREYVNFFKVLAARLGVKCRGYNTFGCYLLYNLGNIPVSSYALLYEELGAATLIVVNKKQLLTAVDFTYQKDALGLHRYLTVGGCERLIENHKIEKLYVCSEDEINIDGAEIYDIDFSVYKWIGFKL